jgi:4-amino-4-deoxy-L-arabinose transferase-like glycosyltransferase
MDTAAATGAPVKPADGLHDFARGPVLAIAAGTTLLLVAVSRRYGYHRDELYFLEASRHLAFGYVDQPPGAVLVAWISRLLLGNTLVGLRLIPALVDGVVVAMTGLMARELGGRRFAQYFAALCVALSGFLVIGHLEGPTIYDALSWALVSFLVMRILRTGNARLWLVVGLTVGVGVEFKESILFLCGALIIGLLVNRQARELRSPWLWTGAGIAVLLWAPNLIWEATHHWPVFEMDANLRAEHSGLGYAVQFPFISILAMGPVVAPVWMAGWWALLRRESLRRYRSFAIAFAFLFMALWLYIPDRFYYMAPLYTVMFAAGALVTEEVAEGVSGFFRARPRRRRMWTSRRQAVWNAVIGGVLLFAIALPLVPPNVLRTVPLQNVNYNLGEEIGWPTLVHQVAGVWNSLPAGERSSAVIVTGNYGEAGAIDRFGAAEGLPVAYSGHNSFWWWGPPSPATGTTIAVGFSRQDLTPYFRTVTLATTLHNPYGVQDDEEGNPVWVCTGQRRPWPAIWPDFRNYG